MKPFQKQYQSLWARLQGTTNSHQQAVGGDFETVGLLEFNLLRTLGLEPRHRLIDVGCGSGRLAAHLASFLDRPDASEGEARGGYLGTDILPDLLEHAQGLCARPDWEFRLTDGQKIPAPDECADFVCFFSVLTHITHEETWRYVLEAKRVLRPGGLLVCSFLEFRIRSHWWIFKNTFADSNPNKILNQFLSRDAFEAFAFNAALDVEGFHDGDQPHILLEREIVWENGVRMAGLGNLGQSICILRKPLEPRPLPL